MGAKPIEILCTACGADTLVRREPVYEGLKKTGERFLCSSCGHEFPTEAEIPFKQQKKTVIFTEADKLKKVDVFRGDDKGRICRYCTHYTVNPFTQRCGLNNRIIQATDTCEKFEKKPPPKPVAGADADKPKLPDVSS